MAVWVGLEVPTCQHRSLLMPRYFFHMQTGTRHTDPIGIELPSHKEARAEAIRTVGEMLKDSPEGFWSQRPWSVTVTDASGLIFYEIMIDGVAAPVAGERS